jgi:hypothetical protein
MNGQSAWFYIYHDISALTGNCVDVIAGADRYDFCPSLGVVDLLSGMALETVWQA